MKLSRKASPTGEVDAVIIGAGHHGLVAACTLADAGWDVVVLEARQSTGGAIHSVTRGDFVFDEFSACYPLVPMSPVLRELQLQGHGLEWAHAARTVAHVGDPSDTHGAVIESDPARTAAALDVDAPGDGAAWLKLVAEYDELKESLFDALLTQWPPTTTALKALSRIGIGNVSDFARFALMPASQLCAELFRGDRAADLIAGSAMHADIPLESPGSGLYGWLMAMLAQDVGFPGPRGGSSKLADALTARAQAAGAVIQTNTPVASITVSAGRATGVITSNGKTIRARRAVIADTSAPNLYRHLLSDAPTGLLDRLDRFAWDLPTVKLNIGLSAAMPWTAENAHGAGVVHVGHDHRGLIRWAAELGSGVIPQRPFALTGQMTTIDATRSPAGSESFWLYTHLPRGVHDDASAATLIDNSERMLDDFAPGWRELVVDRWDQRPSDLLDADANLGAGAVGGGTMQLFQQLFWRPMGGLGGPRTYVSNLYLGSAATHPGGGVHGGSGYLAARAALNDSNWWGKPAQRLSLAALHRMYDKPPRF